MKIMQKKLGNMPQFLYLINCLKNQRLSHIIKFLVTIVIQKHFNLYGVWLEKKKRK